MDPLSGTDATVGILLGFIGWFLVRYLLAGLYTVDQNERAVKTVFGRAHATPIRSSA
jgi:regulator of protease activity HflC (stomatin/prohibitin superfamily)